MTLQVFGTIVAATLVGHVVGLVVDSKNPIDAPTPDEEKGSERRRSRRAKIVRPVRVRPSGPKDEHFEDFPTSVNASREGIYFLTRTKNYYVGMRLFITFPYVSPNNPMNCEYLAHVVRVEGFGSNKFGVAVELLSTVDATGSKPK